MSNEEVAVALEAHEHEIGSLKHRMDAVEKANEALNKLATAVEVMAAEQKNQSETMKDIKKDVTALGTKVDVIENKPAKHWESMVGCAISVLIGAFLLWLAEGMPGVAG